MALGGKQFPVSFWPLLGLAAIALLFVLLRDQDETQDLITGGPVVSLLPEHITALELVRVDGRYRLERDGENWRLSGDVSDDVSPGAVAEFLRALALGTGGAVMPGSEPRDGRYGFGGPNAASLRIEDDAGEHLQIDFGDFNPVTRTCYASGAGRQGVFPVTAEFRDLMIRLPELIRINTLLPPFERGLVRGLRIWRRGSETPLELRYRDERWWLREPAGGLAALGSLVRSYHHYYRDRRQRLENVLWLQADRRRLGSLIYEVGETGVMELGPLWPDADFLERVGLLPPYRRVELNLADRDEPLVIELGEEVEMERIYARRRGNLVIAHAAALKTVQLSTARLVDTGALSFSLALADSLRLIQNDNAAPPQPLIWAIRTAVGEADSIGLVASSGGIWRTRTPAGFTLALPRSRLDNQAQDRVVDLDRLAIERVLPPFLNDPDNREGVGHPPADSPLAASPRVSLVAWYTEATGPRSEEVVFGRLERTWPPSGWSPDPALTAVAGAQEPAPAGTPVLYDARTGKLLVVSEEVLISFRAMRNNLVRR